VYRTPSYWYKSCTVLVPRAERNGDVSGTVYLGHPFWTTAPGELPAAGRRVGRAAARRRTDAES